MPKGIYERKDALQADINELRALLTDTRTRLEAAEKRIGEMNLAFERGYLPPNVQAHS